MKTKNGTMKSNVADPYNNDIMKGTNFSNKSPNNIAGHKKLKKKRNSSRNQSKSPDEVFNQNTELPGPPSEE